MKNPERENFENIHVDKKMLEYFDFLLQFILGIWSDFFFFVFLGPCQQHMEVPRLGVQSER